MGQSLGQSVPNDFMKWILHVQKCPVIFIENLSVRGIKLDCVIDVPRDVTSTHA